MDTFKIRVEKKGKQLFFPDNIVDKETIYSQTNNKGDFIIAVFTRYNEWGSYFDCCKLEGEYLISCKVEEAKYYLIEMGDCTSYNLDIGENENLTREGMTWNAFLKKEVWMPTPVGIFLQHYESD